MRVIIKDHKLLTIAEPKLICFDLSKNVDNNLKHEIKHVNYVNKHRK